MAKRTAAIMQPTHLPWIGYFDLIDQVDRFLFLDSVQFSKRSWQQRNRVKSHSEAVWLTVPVLSKGRRDQTIAEVEIDPEAAFHLKHLKTISHLYAKAPFFEHYFEDFSSVLEKEHRQLSELNIELIQWFCEALGIETEMGKTTDLDVEGSKAELLIDICHSVGANVYLSAEGSRTYIDENNQFQAQGIGLEYHAYSHPEYKQLHGDFLPYLSVLDLLFNEGPDSLEIIRSGRGRSSTG